MYIHIIGLILLFVFGGIFLNSSWGKNRKYFLVCSFSMMALILGLRSNTVGEDTEHYVDIFLKASGVSWQDMISSRFKTVYSIDQFGYKDKIENGFLVITKIIKLFTDSSQIYLLILAGITCYCFAKFIKDNCQDVFMPTYIFMCESMYMYSFNGVRQMMALSIGINAYTLLKGKKIKKAIGLILLAAFIHNSALIYFALFPIFLIKKKNQERNYKLFKYSVVACIVIPFLLPVVKIIISYILPRYIPYLTTSYWQAQLGGTIILWILEILLILYMYKQRFYVDESYNLATLTLIYLMLEGIGLQFTGIGRLALYFRGFLVCFFPVSLSYFRGKNRQIIKLIIYVLLLLLFFSYARTSTRQYSFLLQ